MASYAATLKPSQGLPIACAHSAWYRALGRARQSATQLMKTFSGGLEKPARWPRGAEAAGGGQGCMWPTELDVDASWGVPEEVLQSVCGGDVAEIRTRFKVLDITGMYGRRARAVGRYVRVTGSLG